MSQMAVDDCAESTKLFRVRISAEADPGVVARLLGHFPNMNVIPHRIVAELATTGLMYVQIDVSGVSESRVSLIVAKMGQCVPVLNAYWHWLVRVLRPMRHVLAYRINACWPTVRF